MSKFRVLIICFFLAFTTTFVHAKDPEVVTDVNGKELCSGASYYMKFPFPRHFNRTPTVDGDISDGSCPFGNVTLSYWRKRLPTSITPVGSNSTVILVDSNVTVSFNCRPWTPISPVWKIGPGDRVTTGGAVGLNWFKITKHACGNNTYRLDACQVPGHGRRCDPVGYFNEDNVRYLVAGTVPLPIVFVPEKPKIANKLSSM